MSGRPQKILFVITDLRIGGAEAMLTRMVTAEPRLADEITVASLLPADAYLEQLRAADIRVIEFDFSRPFGAATGLIGLAKLISEQKPDIVQGWMYHGDLAAALALKISARRKRTALIWGVRCSELDFSRYSYVLRSVVKACALLSGYPDVITANSAAGVVAHVALGYHPRRIEVVANGIDVSVFKPNAPARAAVRNRLGISNDSIVVAHSARVDPMKDHETFLAAMAELPDLHALVFGTGTEGLPHMPNILRLGRREDVPALLAAADLVVSSSAFGEGFSNAIAEGMSCALPAVATDVGDAREIVGDTGSIVAPGDPRALADAIRALAVEAPTARSLRGSHARERIFERFSLDRAVRRFADLYETVCAGRA